MAANIPPDAPADLQELFEATHLAKTKAYCPYSNFRVGAALLASSGKIYSGCNVENASYPVSTCAERTAIVKAVSEGERKFSKIAVTSDVEKGFASPCGMCRQAMAEFGLDLEVYFLSSTNGWEKHTLRELLPESFCSNDLDKVRESNNSMNS